ncbi:MAG: response regulator [Deltaproteobacteria bacterium]|nr:response regulator [Deltaproteobacteria bacterium]
MTDRVKKRILVVDDEAVIRMLLSDLLSEAGYIVDTIGDPIYAVREFDSPSKYDLIILDINMPKMDGITLFRNITKGFPEVKNKFLFITRNLTEEALSFFKENDCQYLTKPADLLTQVNSIFNKEENGLAPEDAV